MVDGTEYVGSHEKSESGRGQNGDASPSSVTDLKNIPQMNRDYGLSSDPSVSPVADQMRTVSKEGYKPAFGMKAQSEPAKIPDANIRRSSKQAAPGSYQR